MLTISKTSLKVSLAGIFLLAFCSIGRAQESSLKAQEHVLKVDVDLALISITVSDPQGRFVTDLGPERFQVWEDKVEQKIEYFSQEEVPLSVGVVFDASGSMKDKAARARDAVRGFMALGNRDDEYFLVEFSTRPKISETFTSDASRLLYRIIFAPARGLTALFDAVYLGLEKIKGHGRAKKALLLITDGEDNHSRYTFSDIKEFAKEQDVQIFAIGTLDLGTWRGNGRALMEQLVDITGGKAFFPVSNNELESICARIALELKNQYIIGYRPMNERKDGKWRKVHVKVIQPKGAPQFSVRAKRGYYAPSSEAPQ